MTAVCKSTALGAGCGHPTAEHVGNAANPCCCCNWKHNDQQHWENCVECQIRRIKRDRPEPMPAHEMAELMPEHLRSAFWEHAIERYLATQEGAAS